MSKKSKSSDKKSKRVKRISKNNYGTKHREANKQERNLIEGEEKTDEMYENMLGYYFYEFTTSLSIVPK